MAESPGHTGGGLSRQRKAPSTQTAPCDETSEKLQHSDRRNPGRGGAGALPRLAAPRAAAVAPFLRSGSPERARGCGAPASGQSRPSGRSPCRRQGERQPRPRSQGEQAENDPGALPPPPPHQKGRPGRAGKAWTCTQAVNKALCSPGWLRPPFPTSGIQQIVQWPLVLPKHPGHSTRSYGRVAPCRPTDILETRPALTGMLEPKPPDTSAGRCCGCRARRGAMPGRVGGSPNAPGTRHPGGAAERTQPAPLGEPR